MSNLENATIAIQKSGRLTEGSLEWLNVNQGSDFPLSDDPFDKRRELRDRSTGITVAGYSNGDTIKAVACGQTDLGICGGDKYYENAPRGAVRIVESLRFAGCLLVLARQELPSRRPIERIATSYPVLTRQFIDTIGGPQRNIQVDYFAGGIESIGRWAGYDSVVDIVQTGESLRANGYKIADRIASFEAVLIERSGRALEPGLYDAAGQLGILGLMEARLSFRKSKPTDSEASRLVSDENEATKKLGSEVVELVRAVARREREEIVTEAADVLYSLVANLVESGTDLRGVMAELGSRYAQ